MIGWWIIIDAQTPEERDAPNSDRKTSVLAKWETSISGIDWVVKLVNAGKAVQILKGGYPNRYTANACDVLPLISRGVPAHDDNMLVIGDEIISTSGWTGNVVINSEKIAACPPDQILTIEVWDQS